MGGSNETGLRRLELSKVTPAPRPYPPEAKGAWKYLIGAHDSVAGLFSTLHLLRETAAQQSSTRGRLSHEQGDQLRGRPEYDRKGPRGLGRDRSGAGMPRSWVEHRWIRTRRRGSSRRPIVIPNLIRRSLGSANGRSRPPTKRPRRENPTRPTARADRAAPGGRGRLHWAS